MPNYSESAASCRVDFFKPSGKWYSTQAVVFPENTYEMDPRDALREALLKRSLPRQFHAGMTAVCLEPYAANSFPVMILFEG